MSEAVTDDDAWRRLSPLTLLLAIVRLGPGTVRMIPALAAIGIAGNWSYVAPALLAFLLISLAFSWAAWARFRWRIGADAIVIESGIFDRQHRTIPFDRIQDVSIEQGLIARALDIAKVGFETGASAESEKGDGSLDAITVADADALRTTIRDWRSGMIAAASAGESADVAPPQDPVLFTLPPGRLILAGLFNFSLAALAVAWAASQYVDDFLPFDFFDPRDWMDIARQTGVDSWINAHRWVAAIGALATLLFVGFATGVVRTVLTNWNFRLSLGPRAFRRVRGLTTRTDVAIPLARVQAAIVATGLIRRHWGWHELRLQSLASDGAEEKDHQIIPFAQLDDIDTALAPVRLARADAVLEWHRPPLAAQMLGGFIAATSFGTAGVAASALGQWQGPVLLGAAALIAISALLSARAHCWAERDGILYIWRGWWNPRLTILPFANVQSADLADGPVLRRLGVKRLALGVPGDSRMASHDIDGIAVHAAAGLRARILAARAVRA
jgi:putative membrane protein